MFIGDEGLNVNTGAMARLGETHTWLDIKCNTHSEKLCPWIHSDSAFSRRSSLLHSLATFSKTCLESQTKAIN